MSHGGNIAGLDMVRGLAIGLVLIRHATGDTFGGAGIVGVTVFFVLSGYLITGVLDRDLEKYGTVRWGRFYRNRALRLIPALIGLLVIFSLVEIIWSPLNDRDILLQSVVMGATYTANLSLPWEMSTGLGHLWTLAVEEQFYLVWPLLLAFAFRRRWRKKIVAIVAATTLTVACWVSLAIVGSPEDVYSSPLTWASTMALGGLGYYCRDWAARLKTKVAHAAGAGGLTLILFLSLVPGAKDHAFTYGAWPALIAAATVAMIVETVRWRSAPVVGLTPLAWLGKISYGAYLWNMPIVVWVRALDFESELQRSVALLATVPATLLAATLSWYTVEAVGRHWRERTDRSNAVSPVSGLASAR